MEGRRWENLQTCHFPTGHLLENGLPGTGVPTVPFGPPTHPWSRVLLELLHGSHCTDVSGHPPVCHARPLLLTPNALSPPGRFRTNLPPGAHLLRLPGAPLATCHCDLVVCPCAFWLLPPSENWCLWQEGLSGICSTDF